MTEAHERQVHRTSPTSSLLDVLDRVLDKGIVIDAWVRLSLIGIELVTVEARVVVASIATYLGYSEALAELKTAASQAAITPVKQPRPFQPERLGIFTVRSVDLDGVLRRTSGARMPRR
jgi:gas vesicle structural protein